MSDAPWHHLVLSGGGAAGLLYVGVLYELRAQLGQLRSVHGTSVGAIVAALVCLRLDWDALLRYLVECPWGMFLTPTPEQMWSAAARGGVFDVDTMRRIMRPFLGCQSLHAGCTLNQLFAFSGIDLHIHTFDINAFVPLDVSHATHPDLPLVDALTMSCAIPGLVAPVFLGDDQCCIDGGITAANNPVRECLRHYPEGGPVLNVLFPHCAQPMHKVHAATAEGVDMMWVMAANALAYLTYAPPLHDPLGRVATLQCEPPAPPMNPEVMQMLASNPAARSDWIALGRAQAQIWLGGAALPLRPPGSPPAGAGERDEQRGSL